MHLGAQTEKTAKKQCSFQLGMAVYFGLVALMLASVLINSPSTLAEMSGHGGQQATHQPVTSLPTGYQK